MTDQPDDPLSVAPAVPEDFESILALEARSFPECDRMNREELEDFSRRFPEGLFVLKVGSRFAGYILFTFERPEEAYIESVAVEPGFRGRGCGAFVVRWAKTHFADTGHRLIHLHVRQGNSGAVALYKKEGFVLSGTDPSFYADGEPALLMDYPLR